MFESHCGRVRVALNKEGLMRSLQSLLLVRYVILFCYSPKFAHLSHLRRVERRSFSAKVVHLTRENVGNCGGEVASH